MNSITQSAQQAFSSAQFEAQLDNRSWCNTQDLLVCLAELPHSGAQSTLDRCGVAPNLLHKAVGETECLEEEQNGHRSQEVVAALASALEQGEPVSSYSLLCGLAQVPCCAQRTLAALSLTRRAICEAETSTVDCEENSSLAVLVSQGLADALRPSIRKQLTLEHLRAHRLDSTGFSSLLALVIPETSRSLSFWRELSPSAHSMSSDQLALFQSKWRHLIEGSPSLARGAAIWFLPDLEFTDPRTVQELEAILPIAMRRVDSGSTLRARKLIDSIDPILLRGEGFSSLEVCYQLLRLCLAAKDVSLAEQVYAIVEQWNYGKSRHSRFDGLHRARTLLGRVNLAVGRTQVATELLIESVAGSDPALFIGDPPSMTLARDLLQHGHDEVVLEYLDLCAANWPPDLIPIAGWAESVRTGGVPEFPEWQLMY